MNTTTASKIVSSDLERDSVNAINNYAMGKSAVRRTSLQFAESVASELNANGADGFDQPAMLCTLDHIYVQCSGTEQQRDGWKYWLEEYTRALRGLGWKCKPGYSTVKGQRIYNKLSIEKLVGQSAKAALGKKRAPRQPSAPENSPENASENASAEITAEPVDPREKLTETIDAAIASGVINHKDLITDIALGMELADAESTLELVLVGIRSMRKMNEKRAA